MVLKKLELPLAAPEDVVAVRQSVRSMAVETGLSIIDQTKLVTAASELARNTVVHGGGGKATLEVVEESLRRGVRLTFEDSGPGIADIELAMRDGYTTGGGLGLGLGGSKRLANDFAIDSKPGEGTRITIATWKGQFR
jgi:serine/threonine-protein kinase RsbT